MPNTTKHGHKPDMSGLKEGRAYEYRTAEKYVGKPCDGGKPPAKARRQDYTPDTSTRKR